MNAMLYLQGANMAAMLAARSVGPRSDASSPAMQELKALVLLENDPPGWAEQAEMRHVFGQPHTMTSSFLLPNFSEIICMHALLSLPRCEDIDALLSVSCFGTLFIKPLRFPFQH